MVHNYNASSHSNIDAVEVLIAFDKIDNVIDIFCSWRRSPHFRVLNLDIFLSLQYLQDRTNARKIDKLVTLVAKAFHRTLILWCWTRTGDRWLEEIMKSKAVNEYHIVHNDTI